MTADEPAPPLFLKSLGENLMMFRAGIVASRRRVVAYSGPGDVVSGAAFWWGLRAYNAAARGGSVVDVVRASDSASQTFVSLADGSLDVASITTFLAATTGKVSKLWDQSGSGNHLVQATDAARPAFTFNGGNGLPCLTFSGAQKLAGVNNLGSISATTLSAVACRTGDFSANSAIVGSGDFDTLMFFAGADTVKIYSNPTDLSAAAADSVWHAINGVYTAAGASSSITLDGSTTSGTIGTVDFGQSGTPPSMGQATGANFPLTGKISEAGVWSTNFDGTQLADIDANQRSYWGF